MRSHSVTCHPTQANTPRLGRQTGRYSIYLPRMDGRLSWSRWLVTCRNGLSVYSRSPIQVVTGPGVLQLCCVNHYIGWCTVINTDIDRPTQRDIFRQTDRQTDTGRSQTCKSYHLSWQWKGNTTIRSEM